MLAEDLLQAFQRSKYAINGFIISLLAGGEPGFINAVIHAVVNPAVQFIDVLAQCRRVVIAGGCPQPVEGGIEHTNNFS
nr:Uncharacterised protein [Raoultella sp. NCTC 9187]